MKYLREFNNHAAYEAAKGSLILPNVSLCVNENDVHYHPYVDPYNGHEYVEIGGIKWATMNVGATGVTDAGLYFQWGDVSGYTAVQVGSGEGQKNFAWGDYKYCDDGSGTPESMTKYTGNGGDGKLVLELSDDSVRANWGGGWRMPTTEEFQALGDAATSVWTTNYEGSGVSGLVVTDKTDSSKVLFFPAVGYANNGNMFSVNRFGYYWSSSRNGKDARYACCLFFSRSTTSWDGGNNNRFYGYPVRGVVR